MWKFHHDLSAMHSYQSPSWSWLLLKRPVSYFFCSGFEGSTPCHPGTAAGNYEEIMATGNPFVWWTSLIALAYITVAWVRRRDWRRAEGFILAGFAFTYGPWLLPLSNRSATFIFYLLPTIPFMCLGLAYVAELLGRSWEARTAIGIYAVALVGTFVFYYPLLAKTSLPQPDWQKRIWIFDNCEKPPGKVVQVTSTETKNGKEKVTTSASTDDFDGPPSGWCWI
jgi:dolichyl-phosphate-mannose--protein O-mannosyl transferase